MWLSVIPKPLRILANMAKSNDLDLRATLRRLNKSNKPAEPAEHTKKTFVVETAVLNEFLAVINASRFKQQECITEAIAMWLVKYKKD